MVIGVIYMFLRNASATLIPSIALPISIVGTFSVMYVLHYSLDNLSMMALILSVGFVVDDAIVMLENIVRHLEKGETRMQAALNGSREVVFTIVSMTLSLAAVFIPVLFMAGILGGFPRICGHHLRGDSHFRIGVRSHSRRCFAASSSPHPSITRKDASIPGSSISMA